MIERDSAQTITDFGKQWTRYPSNEGYYASSDMFCDICGALLDIAEFKDAEVADLGSGTGRIVNMLIDAGAARVTAVEPSAAFDALRANTAHSAERVRLVKATAAELPAGPYDFVVSIGVLHHIPDPAPVVRRAFEALRPGGRLLIWLYGKEGNALYLFFALPVRRLTKHLPDGLLSAVCYGLTGLVSAYIFLCRFLWLPARRYMLNVLGRYGWRHRYLTLFDQLNPSYAKYYTEAEARALVQDAGFTEVKLYHRHGYSWTVLGRKPEASKPSG